MRRLHVALVLGALTSAHTAFAQAGSYCSKSPQAPSVQNFRMEAGMESALVGTSPQPTRAQLRTYIDSTLARMQTAKARQISFVSDDAITGDCEASPGLANCIGVYQAQDYRCGTWNYGTSPPTFIPASVLARAGCAPGDCRVHVCPENYNDSTSRNPLTSFNFATVFAHEFGHTFGLNHVEDVSDPFSGCTSSTSSGCSGELMCVALGAISSSSPRNGDARGMRMAYSGSTASPVREVRSFRIADSGTGTIPAPTVTSFLASSAVPTSVFPARIDCVKALGVLNDCAAVRRTNSGTTPMTITRLRKTAGTAAGWTSSDDIATSAQSVLFAPDIAISPDGTRAWIAYSRATLTGLIMVQEFNLTTGALIRTVSLDGATTAGGTPMRAFAALPPRVAWSPALNGPLVLGYAFQGAPTAFQSPELMLWFVRPTDGAVFPFGEPTVCPCSDPACACTSGSCIDGEYCSDRPLGKFFDTVSGDVDLDCAPLGSSDQGAPIDSCLLVVPERSSVTQNHQFTVAEIQLRRAVGFETHPQHVMMPVVVSSHVDEFSKTNGVESVSIRTTGTRASSPVYVSTGRPYDSGFATNGRVHRFSFPNLSSAVIRNVSSDAPLGSVSCGTPAHLGVSMPSFTPRQGVAGVWCHDCAAFEGFASAAPPDSFCH